MRDPHSRGRADAVEENLDELAALLTERSIRFGEFTLASGATSHYYCDTKLTALSPRGAKILGETLCSLLQRFDVEAVGGLAMGASYLATAVAIASEGTSRPIYGFCVRSEQKEHGRGQKIDVSWHPEGDLLTPGRRVALLDDVVTSAGSVLRALDAVEEVGCEVAVVAAVLDRQAGGAERIRKRGYPFYALLEADEKGRLRPGFDADSLR